jgi:hypothetical protein
MLLFIWGIAGCVGAEVAYAVNCGGDEYIDSQGVMWAKDKDFEGGNAVVSETKYVRFTQDPYIYMTERQNSDEIAYSLPRLGIGKYVIILKFSEYFNARNKKLFNIAIGSTAIVTNMDLYEGIKDSCAIDEFIPVTVTDKGLHWNGLYVPDAFKSDRMVLKITKNEGEGPKICGVMIVNGTLEDTHYAEHIQKVQRFKSLSKNKQEIAELPLVFPTSHQILTPVTISSVIFKYPFTIAFSTLALYILLSKLTAKTP